MSTKRNRKWRDHSAMTTGETHWPDILAMFVITENYRDDSGTAGNIFTERDLPCDLPCAASLAGIQPVRPRAQWTNP